MNDDQVVLADIYLDGEFTRNKNVFTMRWKGRAPEATVIANGTAGQFDFLAGNTFISRGRCDLNGTRAEMTWDNNRFIKDGVAHINTCTITCLDQETTESMARVLQAA